MFLNHVALAIPMRDAEKLQKKIRVAAASGCSGLFRAFCGFGQLSSPATSGLSLGRIIVRKSWKAESAGNKRKEAEDQALTDHAGPHKRGVNLSGENRSVRNELIPSLRAKSATKSDN